VRCCGAEVVASGVHMKGTSSDGGPRPMASTARFITRGCCRVYAPKSPEPPVRITERHTYEIVVSPSAKWAWPARRQGEGTLVEGPCSVSTSGARAPTVC
jgi:hypothetical protein